MHITIIAHTARPRFPRQGRGSTIVVGRSQITLADESQAAQITADVVTRLLLQQLGLPDGGGAESASPPGER